MSSPWEPHRAFTLVEILCAMLLGTVIMGASLGLLSGCIKSYEQTLALTQARRRGEMVVQILRLPVENAGLGIPSNEQEYRTALSIDKVSLPALIGWNAPVSVSGNELRLVYTLPTTIVNEAEATETMPSEDRNVLLSIVPTAGQIEAAPLSGTTQTRSWIVFPPSPIPFLANSLNNRNLAVRSAMPSWIAHNARLHYLRGIRALVTSSSGKDPAFCTEDVTSGAGLQERVPGIPAIRFVFDPASQVLSTMVLSMGGNRQDFLVSPSSLPGWPDSIPQENRHYRLAVTTWTCRVRNGND